MPKPGKRRRWRPDGRRRDPCSIPAASRASPPSPRPAIRREATTTRAARPGSRECQTTDKGTAQSTARPEGLFGCDRATTWTTFPTTRYPRPPNSFSLDRHERIYASALFTDFDVRIGSCHACELEHLRTFSIHEKPIEMHFHQPPARAARYHVAKVKSATARHQGIEAPAKRDRGEQL